MYLNRGREGGRETDKCRVGGRKGDRDGGGEEEETDTDPQSPRAAAKEGEETAGTHEKRLSLRLRLPLLLLGPVSPPYT